MSQHNNDNGPGQNNNFHYRVEVKPHSLKDFCNLYGITRKTFHKWLAPFKELLGEKIGRFYSVLQVDLIFNKLGAPHDRFLEW